MEQYGIIVKLERLFNQTDIFQKMEIQPKWSHQKNP